jgi:hypothetical protein
MKNEEAPREESLVDLKVLLQRPKANPPFGMPMWS